MRSPLLLSRLVLVLVDIAGPIAEISARRHFVLIDSIHLGKNASDLLSVNEKDQPIFSASHEMLGISLLADARFLLQCLSSPV